VIAVPVPQRNWTAKQQHSTNQQTDPPAYNIPNPSTSATVGNQYDSLNMCQVGLQRQTSDDSYLKPDHYDYIATATQEDGAGFSVVYHQ